MEPTVLDALAANASGRADDAAFLVVAAGQVHRLSWGELLVATVGQAERLADVGVGEGDIVLVGLRHGPSMYPVYLGAMLAGAIPSFVAFPTPKQDSAVYWDGQRELVDRVRPSAVVASSVDHAAIGSIVPVGCPLLDVATPAQRHDVAELASAIKCGDPDRVALVQHSSGTTGSRKGVALTYRQIAAQVVALADALALDARSRVASWLPLYHDMGLVTGFLAPIHVGATVVSIDAFEWVEAPHLLLELIDAERCDLAWLPNFAFHHLVRTKRGDETYRLDHVRAFVNCSEPCRAETFAEFASVFGEHGVRPDQLQVSYAMAETVFAMTQTPLGLPPRTVYVDRASLANGRARVVDPGPNAVAHVSAGPALPGVTIRVDGADGSSDNDGVVVGGLLVRGDWVFDGYHANPDATAAAFVAGWFRTGDVGYVLDDQVVVLGRTDDVIVHHGINLYAHDLEAAAATVTGVKPGRCAAVAVFDAASGSDRIEVIVERDPEVGMDDDELAAALKRAISDRFLNVTVAEVHLVGAGWLVKTTSGKVSRRENVAKLRRVGAATDPVPAPRSTPPTGDRTGDLADLVVQTIAETFDVDVTTIGRGTVAADVPGWDSLGQTVLLVRVGRAIGRDVPESVAARAHTVGELVDMIGNSS